VRKGLTGGIEAKPAGAALRQVMQGRKSATLDEIREALDRGISWGKYPKRQVALAVANSPKLYAQQGDLVTLIPNPQPVGGGTCPTIRDRHFGIQCLPKSKTGRSEIKGQSGRKMMPTIFATLTITGKNEAWLPQDPLTEPVAVTVDDVVRRVIGLFQQSGGPVASIHSGLAQARKAAGRPADEVFDDLEREGAGG
jgi:hypothetical protein